MIQTRTAHLPHGIHLECHVAGAAGRPVLVFVHGFPEAAFVWDDLLRHFAQPEHGGYRCVAPNLRGYAGSSAPAEVSAYRAKHLVQDLKALIDQVTADSPTPGQAAAVVAHDWGGAVTWGLAAQHPEAMRQLAILNAPHAGLFARELQNNPLQQAASAYMNFLVRPDAEALLAENDFARLWPFFTQMGDGAPWLTEALRERYRAVWRQGLTGPLNYYRASPLRPATAHDAGASGVQLPPALLRVSVPTLVLWGLGDHALLPSLLDGLEAHVPRLRVERLPDASHWLVHEQPARVQALLGDFLAG
ncbi:alpha/beta fold hydrolase [Aquabacterium sp. A08]|uniref:alpha/beta fold hydrolase n=1 Tax=Aquabacterium sp. A08 TaxID=2718532 RepID=UPI001420E400|nr:alpha/beta fold hydrolase [Aquabacterium sp. A08]NIC42449.1 alpha/beta fold hydrolase [Aquabacterium sp. A08]NIC42488.1 alpha/beta fold hydrolase [Aquabacterium sp. A08]